MATRSQTRPRVLVIDDEAALRDLLDVSLRQAGFHVGLAANGAAGIALAVSTTPDIIVLDVMLPGADGFLVLPALRQITEVPIVMLSARSATRDKIAGLTSGADDYIDKPFDLNELIARLQTALRRPHLAQRESFLYDDLMVDPARYLVVRGSRRIELSSREFDLLVTLIRRPGQVFSRDKLLDLVWGVDRTMSPGIIETYISHLRRKIDYGEAHKLIKTIRCTGYTLWRDGHT
jgi:DNA-binding response OmpR family regulator